MLKGLYNILEKQTEVMEEMIENRERVFENRSENWQDSNKGMEYGGQTEQLQEILDVLTDLLLLIEVIKFGCSITKTINNE